MVCGVVVNELCGVFVKCFEGGLLIVVWVFVGVDMGVFYGETFILMVF